MAEKQSADPAAEPRRTLRADARRNRERVLAAAREAFAAELIDRFGPLPEETKQLLEITAVKILCKRLGVAKVSAGPKGALLGFRETAPLDTAKLVAYVQKRPNALKLRPDMKLVAGGAWPDAPARLAAVKTLLKDMSTLL